MWEYIGNLGKAIRNYRTGIVATACSMAISFFGGCEGINELNRAGPGQPYSWLTDEERAADAGRHHDFSDWEMGNMRLEWETEKLKSLNRQLELENSARIFRMQQELKRQELQRKFNGMNR